MTCIKDTLPGQPSGRFEAVVADTESFGLVEVYLLSLWQLVPLILLTSSTARDTDHMRQLDLQYTPLHIMHLPLRQVCSTAHQ
jgi:hypothetical protein